ncbi:hypothetical protein ABC383_02100 [Noviherbaspirillum sp. 1P10PC]|uniref:hypothetical protein n=1 Tax=Noviherbaspirillum sp. 1P10PC TaxID=3132292 RepID=UPI0039A3A323
MEPFVFLLFVFGMKDDQMVETSQESIPMKSPDILAHDHERRTKLFGAYIAFIAAAVVGAIANDGKFTTQGWMLSLWMLSLPFLGAYLLVDHIVSVVQKREVSGVRGALQYIGLSLSNLGFAALLAAYSWIVSILYIGLVLSLFFVVISVVMVGKHSEDY